MMQSGIVEDYVDDGTPRSFRRSLGTAVLAIGSFLVGAMLTIMIPILPNVAKELTGGTNTLGSQMLIAAPMLGLVIGGLLATMVFARIAPRTVFLGSLVLYGAVGLIGYVADLPTLIASRVLIGAISALIGAASTALVGERVAPENRPRVLGFAVACSSALGIIAMIVSGRVADHAGWRSSFLVFPVLAALVFVVAATCSSPSKARTAMEGPKPGYNWSGLIALWPIFLFVLVINITAFTTNSQQGFLLAEDGVTAAGTRAMFGGINQAMLVVAAFSFPLVRRLIGFRLIPALILLVMGTGLTLLGTSHGLAGVGFALGVLGIGNGLLFPFQSSIMLQRAAPNVRGQAAGLMVSCQFIADALNPFALAPAIQLIGLRNTIALVGVMALIGCAAAVVIGVRVLSNAEPPKEGQLSHG
jgi:predicted MFS family arabinose efflux permease